MTDEILTTKTYVTPGGRQVTLGIRDGELSEEGVAVAVISQDEYQLEQWSTVRPVKYVVNLGTHIGTFECLTQAIWPECVVHGYEWSPYFCQRTRRNTSHFNTVNTFNTPVVAPRIIADPEHFTALHDLVQRKELMRAGISWPGIAARLPRVDLLKMDIEGAEGNLLHEMDVLDVIPNIPRIVGEWHFEDQKQAVKQILGRTHHVDIVDSGDWNLFFATRL